MTVPENGLLFADLEKPLLLDHFNITIGTNALTDFELGIRLSNIFLKSWNIILN